MKLKFFSHSALLVCSVLAVGLFSCGNSNSNAVESGDEIVVDTVAVVPERPMPVANDTINNIARIMAGIPLEEGELFYEKTQTSAWKNHKASMDRMWNRCQTNLEAVQGLAAADLADVNEKVKTVFYPFSGPDFVYPSSLYPEADTYWLAGLEPAGSAFTEASANSSMYTKCSYALRSILYSSFFITKDMASDLSKAQVNGTTPLLELLIVKMGYSLISVGKVSLDAEGKPFADPNGYGVEIKFFKPGVRHEQTLYYLSTNIADGSMKPEVQALYGSFDKESTATFVKSCSYCLHGGQFSKMRGYILDNTFAVVEDDTGVPYKYMNEKGWEVTFYGQYVHPISLFSEYTYQKDLVKAWSEKGSKPLPFRIGYGKGSSLLIGRAPAAVETKEVTE